MTPRESAPPRRLSFDDRVAASLRDPDAFDKLCKEFRAFLRAWVLEHFPDGDSDLVQDAFLVGLQRLTSFRGNTEEEFAGWLRALVRHLALNDVRTKSRADRNAVGFSLAGVSELDWPDPGQVPPDQALAENEQAATVRSVVQGLPADHQVALDLRFQDRLSFSEIGRRLGRSADAARKLVSRARESVRRRLDGKG